MTLIPGEVYASAEQSLHSQTQPSTYQPQTPPQRVLHIGVSWPNHVTRGNVSTSLSAQVSHSNEVETRKFRSKTAYGNRQSDKTQLRKFYNWTITERLLTFHSCGTINGPWCWSSPNSSCQLYEFFERELSTQNATQQFPFRDDCRSKESKNIGLFEVGKRRQQGLRKGRVAWKRKMILDGRNWQTSRQHKSV